MTVRLAAVVIAALVAGMPALGTAAPAVSFDRDIRPILSENCFACHGPDAANQQAGLRLDRPEDATKELDSGSRAIVPGDTAASEIIARVRATDPDVVMPPPEAKIGRLSAAQVALLERWINEGAKYEPHWSFLPPRKPSLPAADTPAGLAAGIDGAVEATLASRGLALQPEAGRRTLIRRLSFDLTGLPPTPAEVEAFVADSAADAYERVVDRLLASPRYGERMAADWLDLARYSDSYGFQVDRPRPTMWPWRDWVISAFNRNLPWDQFTLWQVAGDLLPGATREQVLATAFNRLHQQESEGGSVEEEYRVAYVNDRTTTFGTAFLGLTLECCRCHDHKFDPLAQREFYALSAFFDDIDEAGLYSHFTQAVPTPKLRLADDRQTTALARAEEACGEAEAELVEAVQATRRSARSGAIPDTGRITGELVHYAFDERRADGRFASTGGEAGQVEDDDGAGPDDRPADAVDVAADPHATPPPPAEGLAAASPEENVLVAGRPGHGRAILLTGDHGVSLPVGNFRRSHPFTVSLWLRAPAVFDRAVVFHRSKAWTDAGSRGYELLVDRGHLRWSLIHFWPGDVASVRVREPLAIDEWTHVAVSSDGSGRAAGLKVYVNGQPAATEIVRDSLTREITGGGGDTITIGERMRDQGFKAGIVDDFRVFDRELAVLEVREAFAPGAIRTALADAASAEAVAELAAMADGTVAAKRAALEAARRARDDHAERVPEVMVMRDLPQPRMAHLLERGDYDKRGAAVEPGTPAVLPPFPADQPRNRLGLARWLIDPEHPLLARVTVNRLWQSLFGLGLVQSPEDLGSQSTRPEHPEVLDLLAWSFAHPAADGGMGWDLKRLVKAIVLSRTYRQRSLADDKTMADDPLNVWLARGPRHRLPAEMIRDGALAAAGLLVERIGGPPVKPYDLADSFKPEPPDAGDALYRRSLYTFWRRTGPAPIMETFDVPKRVVCVARRDTTNTPLHAFVLLNATQFVEAARVLAETVLAETPGDPQAALAAGFSRLTSRPPDAEETRIIGRMHDAQLAWYRAHPAEAERFVSQGARPRAPGLPAADLAAATAVINALMNLDGCVVKR
jgi:hypothetical protein